VGVLAGAEAIAINFFESPDAFGLILGLASAVVLLYLSVRLSEMVLFGFGTVGLFVFVLHFIGEYLADGLGGPAALLIAGSRSCWWRWWPSVSRIGRSPKRPAEEGPILGPYTVRCVAPRP
jgi:hypothetical protein